MDKARQRAIDARRLPGQEAVRFRAIRECDCGCGSPARFEFSIGFLVFCIEDVKQVDALIEEMKLGREELWGKP